MEEYMNIQKYQSIKQRIKRLKQNKQLSTISPNKQQNQTKRSLMPSLQISKLNNDYTKEQLKYEGKNYLHGGKQKYSTLNENSDKFDIQLYKKDGYSNYTNRHQFGDGKNGLNTHNNDKNNNMNKTTNNSNAKYNYRTRTLQNSQLYQSEQKLKYTNFDLNYLNNLYNDKEAQKQKTFRRNYKVQLASSNNNYINEKQNYQIFNNININESNNKINNNNNNNNINNNINNNNNRSTPTSTQTLTKNYSISNLSTRQMGNRLNIKKYIQMKQQNMNNANFNLNKDNLHQLNKYDDKKSLLNLGDISYSTSTSSSLLKHCKSGTMLQRVPGKIKRNL